MNVSVNFLLVVLPVEDSGDDSSNDFYDNILFIALLAAFAAVAVIATAVAVYTKVKNKKKKAVIG